MNDQTYVRLKHMLDASRAAIGHLTGKKREDLDINRTILSAIVRELEIIGEAANSIPATFKNLFKIFLINNLSRYVLAMKTTRCDRSHK